MKHENALEDDAGGGERRVARARVPARRPVPARLPAPRRRIQRRRRSRRPAWGPCSPPAPRRATRGGTSPSGSAAAGSIKPGGTLQGRAHRRAGHARPGDVHDLHRRAGLRQHLQQAHRHRHGRRVRTASSRPSGTQTDDKTWMFNLVDNATFHNGEAVHRGRREVHLRAHPRSEDRERRTRRSTTRSRPSRRRSPTQVIFHLKSPFGPFLSQPREQRRDREPEGDRGGGSRRATRSAPGRSSSWSGCRATTSRSRSSTATSRTASRTSTAIEFKFLLVDQSRIDGLSAGELDWVDAVPLQQPDVALERPARSRTSPSATAGIPDYLALNTAQAAVRRQARPAGGRTGPWTGRRSATSRTSGAGEVGIEEVPTGSTVVRRHAGRRARPRTRRRAAGSRPGSATV